jgi:hypothetical protein
VHRKRKCSTVLSQTVWLAARLLFCGVQYSVVTGLSRKERLLKHAAVIWSRVTMDVMEGAPTNTRFIFPRCTSSTHSQKSMEMLLLSDQLLPSRQTALRADHKPFSKDQHVQQTRSWIKLPIGHSSLPLARCQISVIRNTSVHGPIRNNYSVLRHN